MVLFLFGKRRLPMSNITLSVDDEIISKVRKMAIDKNTTLTAMVRNFLTTLANQDAQQKKMAAETLRRSFQELNRDMGPRTWTREALYDR